MLTLTQAAVGLFVCGLLLGDLAPEPSAAAILSLVLGAAGMTATSFHLGRPLWGFRAVLGLRTSWLSREVVALAAFAGLLGVFVLSGLAGVGTGTAPAVLTALVGLGAVYCSAKVYEDTPRAYWATRRTLIRFALSALTSGILLLLAVTTGGSGEIPLRPLAIGAIAAKLIFESADLRSSTTSGILAARLLRGPLRETLYLRLALAARSACCLVASVIVPSAVWLGAVIWLLGEGVERHLFFCVAGPPRMP
jgi:DMSO reductase anchor subunit